MKRCVIFCAGGFSGLLAPVTAQDHVIAADGGLAHCSSLGLTADVVLGDFDSLGYIPEGAQVFPSEKDDTDTMLAVRKGLEAGCREFWLYGSLDGDRLDHTVANFQTLQFIADQGARGYLIGCSTVATVMKNGSVRFSEAAQGMISVFCLGADASGVSITGLKYPVEDAVFTAGMPLGVSNEFIGTQAQITVKNGSLLILYNRQNNLPEEPEILI